MSADPVADAFRALGNKATPPSDDVLLDAYIVLEVRRRGLARDLAAVKLLDEEGLAHAQDPAKLRADLRKTEDELKIITDARHALAEQARPRDYAAAEEGLKRLQVKATIQKEDREKASASADAWRKGK